jgi:hypothetical protein
MSEQPKLKIPTFEVTYYKEDGTIGSVAIIRPVPLSKLADVKILTEKLIEKFVEFNRALANLLTDSTTLNLIEDLAAMLPVVGGGVGIDVDNLAAFGDLAQIGSIFFSESITSDMRAKGWNAEEGLYYNADHRIEIPKPSAIARIHDMDFFTVFVTCTNDRVRQEQEKEEKTKTTEPRKNKKPVEIGNAT